MSGTSTSSALALLRITTIGAAPKTNTPARPNNRGNVNRVRSAGLKSSFWLRTACVSILRTDRTDLYVGWDRVVKQSLEGETSAPEGSTITLSLV